MKVKNDIDFEPLYMESSVQGYISFSCKTQGLMIAISINIIKLQ